MGKSQLKIDLTGKAILVTGASSGIGAQAALTVAEAGADTIIHYNSNPNGAEDLAAKICDAGGRAILVCANLTNKSEVVSLFKNVQKECGRLDVLINNAGIMRPGLLPFIEDSDLENQIDLNLKGALYCMQRAAKIMARQNSGKIINISSVVAQFGAVGQTVYAATKGGINAMTLSASREFGALGITVNAVAPGVIKTDLIASLSDKELSEVVDRISLGRLGLPIDVANVLLFLSSDYSNYITGQVIGVDGGYVI